MEFLKEKSGAIHRNCVLTMGRAIERVKGYPLSRERKIREIFSVYCMPMTKANVEMLFEKSTEYSIINNIPIVKGVMFEHCESVADFVSCCDSLGVELWWRRVAMQDFVKWL